MSSLGPHCKALGIDEEVLGGQKPLKVELEDITNQVAWELRKHKVAKKIPMNTVVDWFIKLLDLKCENNPTLENDLNDKMETLFKVRGTFMKAPKTYPGEVDRLMMWRFDVPTSMGVDATPPFEPMERATLGPKLLKVLKEKGADVEDSMDVSGLSDDDDEQAKRRKAREEIIQLKKDLGTVRKAITSLNDRLNEMGKQCEGVADASKISVSERRRIEVDLTKMTTEWDEQRVLWHDCLERLNYANSNKTNYLDVGYMVRRNKSKQSIFDELNFEFEKTMEEFKSKVNSLLNKERQKKKPPSREYTKAKSKTDRKRKAEADDDKSDDAKKARHDESVQPEFRYMPVDEFMKSELVEEFKGGKFSTTLKVVYADMISAPVCESVQEIFFTILKDLDNLNIDKIPALLFSVNIYMEVKMLARLRGYSKLIKTICDASISNDGNTKFNWLGARNSYEVALPDESKFILGIRDLSYGNPDTSLDFLKELLGQISSAKVDSNVVVEELAHQVKSLVGQGLLDKKFLEIVFLYKQMIMPKLRSCLDIANSDISNKVTVLNNFCTGLYFLMGLAELADVTVLSWELMLQSNNTSDVNEVSEVSLSKTAQSLINFCCSVDPYEEGGELGKEFNNFLITEKKVECTPLAPHKSHLFNVMFHNSAGVWLFHEVGMFPEFIEKLKTEETQLDAVFTACSDKQFLATVRALGLIGKLVATPIWTMLEDAKVEVGSRYITLLKHVEAWSKDASKFLKGQEIVFEDIPVSYDAVYVSLIQENEVTDSMTKEILEILFTAFIPYIQSFVYGAVKMGSNNMNGDVEADAKTSMHQDFSLFDRITKNLHSASTYALDSLVSYSKTRNGEWHDKLGNKNMKIFEVMQRSSNKQLKSLYKRKIRMNEMKEHSKKKKEEHSRCQTVKKQHKLIDDLMKWGGIWKSPKEIDDRLKRMTETDRLSSLKAQIKFRRSILAKEHEDNLLDLAYDGECFNSMKLQENLKKVLEEECILTNADNFELASATDDESLKTRIYDSCKNAHEIDEVPQDPLKSLSIKEDFHWLLGKIVLHTITRGGNKEMMSGICIAKKRVNGVYSYFIRYKEKDVVYKFSESRIAHDYRKNDLQIVDPLSKDLVGSRVSLAFFKDDGDLEWHDCRVVAATSGPNFIIEFDFYGSEFKQDPNESNPLPDIEVLTFTSCLIEDYRTGRLRFL